MRFTPVPREHVGQEWPRIVALIGPAIAYDPNATPEVVREWLCSGRSEAFWIEAKGARGVAVTTTDDEACFINYVGGAVEGGPRAFLQTARTVVDEIEGLARRQGCKELRGGGRNWSRVFPDWEQYDPEHPNRMRKVIVTR